MDYMHKMNYNHTLIITFRPCQPYPLGGYVY